MAISLVRIDLRLKYVPFSILTFGDTFSLDDTGDVWIKIPVVGMTDLEKKNAVKITTGELRFFKRERLVNNVLGEFSYVQEKEHDGNA